VPTLYQNESLLFLYQFANTFFHDIVLTAQANDALMKLNKEMHEAITEFKTECLKDGKEMISKYMHDIIVPGIKEKFLKFKNEEKKIAEGIIQIGTLSETLLDETFTYIK